ncbi:S-protein-like 2, partial [Mucuna pruriens]
MSQFVKSVLFLGLLTLSSTSNGFEPTTHVYVKNALENGAELLLHCKSRDNDLGLQHLHHNESYEFSFKVNFFGTTQFYCSFQWGNNFHWFDIYIASRDDRCKRCSWTVKQNGPCFSLPERTAEQCFPWNK